MKAVIFREHGGPEKLLYADVPEPTIGEGDVLVQVKAASLNHLDIWIREGIPAYPLSLPHISGADIAGIVAKVGPNTRGAHVGDRVIVAPGVSCFECEYCLAGHDNLCLTYKIIGAQTDGGYAEYAAVPARNLIPISDHISFEQAAAFPLVFLTAWHMLIARAGVKPGEDVLILAVGSGVGTAALQVAKLAGARVIAAAGSDEKLEKAKALGADEVINYTRLDFSGDVRRLTGGKGADVVLEHIGPESWEKSIVSLAKNGRLITCGATSGPQAPVELRYLFSRQLTIMGSMMGRMSELLEICTLIEKGRLRPVIDAVYPLREARVAQERMLSRQVFGKLILVP